MKYWNVGIEAKRATLPGNLPWDDLPTLVMARATQPLMPELAFLTPLTTKFALETQQMLPDTLKYVLELRRLQTELRRWNETLPPAVRLRDGRLLRQAFTHKSWFENRELTHRTEAFRQSAGRARAKARREMNAEGTAWHLERLEKLGDAVLDKALCDVLTLSLLSGAPEGSGWRASQEAAA